MILILASIARQGNGGAMPKLMLLPSKGTDITATPVLYPTITLQSKSASQNIIPKG